MGGITYSRRLFIWLLGYSLLLVGCFVTFQYNREKRFKEDEINSQLQLVNSYILNELEEGKSIEGMELSNLHPFEEMRVSVIAKNGDVVYDNAVDSLRRTNHLDREEIKAANRSGSGFAVRRHSESTGKTYFYSALRGPDGRIVRTAVPYSVSLHTLLHADYGFLWIMGGVTIIACVIGYFATRRVGLHVMRLKEFAKSVEKGSKISETEPFPHDELGDISNHIVRLYARLQQAQADRDKEHLATLHEQREKERIKKQLTNNINHELKTPVASIQLCLETMMEHEKMSEEDRRRFLERCLSNTNRLRQLLHDVSLITRMDDGGEAIARERVDLSEIIAEVVADREPIASAKGIAIAADIARPLIVEGNPALLESIFNNLIDNAIAYSGGDRIRICDISDSEGKITLQFSDNGGGVPEEHLSHLFERFYRIDKGRSRACGGTGLGLAIVKNAVLFHNGMIKVRNLKSGGLCFLITFPVKLHTI